MRKALLWISLLIFFNKQFTSVYMRVAVLRSFYMYQLSYIYMQGRKQVDLTEDLTKLLRRKLPTVALHWMHEHQINVQVHGEFTAVSWIVDF